MISLLADEGFDRDIVRGLRRIAGLDVLTVQAAGLAGATDETVLEFAVATGRVLLTQDEATMLPAAWRRVGNAEPLPGVFFIRWGTPPGHVLPDLMLMILAGSAADFEDRIERFPLS